VDPEHQRLLEEGRRAFNRGEFYEAHEFWEEVWNVIDDPERTWIQGLIQAATGLHKLQREQFTPARTLFAKALEKLKSASVSSFGFEVGKLRDQVAATDAALVRGERPDPNAIKLGKA
jgi:predicted metal-dependent hydrolase